VITPTKGIAPERALLSVGAQIAQIAQEPLTISQAWTKLKEWRAENQHSAPISFGWFTLALDILFTLGVAEFDGQVLVIRRADAPAIASA
jgi:hypothetical protein